MVRLRIVTLAVAGVLFLTGAAGQGCSNGQESGSGGVGCDTTHYDLGQEPGSKKIMVRVDTVCAEPVLHHELTITIERRGPDGGWSTVAVQSFNIAPGKGALKKARMLAPCAPGFYRYKYSISVQYMRTNEWQHPAFTSDPPYPLNKKDCE